MKGEGSQCEIKSSLNVRSLQLCSSLYLTHSWPLNNLLNYHYRHITGTVLLSNPRLSILIMNMMVYVKDQPLEDFNVPPFCSTEIFNTSLNIFTPAFSQEIESHRIMMYDHPQASDNRWSRWRLKVGISQFQVQRDEQSLAANSKCPILL